MKGIMMLGLVMGVVVIGCAFVGFAGADTDVSDHYASQVVDADDVKEVQKGSGMYGVFKYYLDVHASHDGQMILKNSDTHRVPYCVLGHRWTPDDFGCMNVVKGECYRLYFDEPLTENSSLVIVWRG